LDLISLIPQFGGLIYTIIAFVVALSVIVAVHEYGHYIVGRWSGIHAEVFSIGFGPVLWSRVDRRGTRWQIAALPFGGYVKFLGDSNAASGKDGDAMAAAQSDPVELRRTMHGAPLWARTATVAAGPVFNFVLSILVFAAIFMWRGAVADPFTVGEIRDLPQGVYSIQAGDEIVAIEGIEVPAFDDGDAWKAFQQELPVIEPMRYSIRRDGQAMDVDGPYLYPPYVVRVAPRSAAMDAGFQPDDVLISVDGAPVFAFDQLKERVESSDGRELNVKLFRDGAPVDVVLAPRRTDEPDPEGGFRTVWRIGIAGGMAFSPATEVAGPVQALVGGASQTVEIVSRSLSGLYHMIIGTISTCNIAGPIGIAETSGDMASQGISDFIAFIAMLSTAVGLVNLFPIPALDGGHLVFYAYEAATGRPPNDKAMQVLMVVGITLILSVMLFAIANDLFC
jgi:regulator of sigma E protease